ncbi:MAG: family protein phosphatase, partial [Solirubrobacteraceae bacterium]|nr:family protein phosphatase [Solirubrobacteraceae bacterium]
ITPQEADEHPQRSIITRALGPEEAVEADSRTWPARAGDVYLLCSDGLTSMVPEAQVGDVVRDAASLPEAGRALIEAANAAGGRDNITVVLFALEDVGDAAPSGRTTEAEVVGADAVGRTPAPATAAAAVAARTQPADEPAPEPATEVPAGPGARRREPRAPRPPREPAAEPRRRRRPRVPTGMLLALFFMVAIALSGWYASQTVYFVGAGSDGFVTVYRGLPYDLPAGLDLYSVNYASGVPVAELPANQRRALGEHKLRSRDDAHDLVRQMETGRLQPG